MLGLGHILSHYSEYVVSSTLSKYSTFIAMLRFYTIVDFHLFYDGAVDIQVKFEPL